MDGLGALIGIIVAVAFFIFLIRIPIIIAKKRGITGSDLTTIAVLSWISLLFGITWIIALVLSFSYSPKREMNAVSSFPQMNGSQKLEELEKLADLRDRGIISSSKFEEEKKKLMI